MRAQACVDKIARRKAYDRIKLDEQCFCGGLKWKGFAFCNACMKRVPGPMRAAMFTSGPADWPDTYDRVRAYLEEGVQSDG